MGICFSCFERTDEFGLSSSSCLPCCGFGSAHSGFYEPILHESERDAVGDLLQYLENRSETNFFEGDPLRALSTLSFSDNLDLQRSAALAFAEITEKDVRPIDRNTLEPIMFLLNSHDTEVQRAASAALGNLAVDNENKVLIVKMGGLDPLVRQMMSPNVEVQCNAVGCITNLATHEENKTRIARSGALIPLTRLARSKDMRVQRNATGALLNMTHSDENRQQLVSAGAVPVLVSLLRSPDTDVQYYCTTALSNIAVDSISRKILAQTEPRLVGYLVGLMESDSLKVQCQAALALRNLASDEKYQLDIVGAGGLAPLLKLLQSSFLPLILSAVACIRNISIHPGNESPIIEIGFLNPLVDLLAYDGNEEIQCHAISTLRNLAASSDRNKCIIVESGAVEQMKDSVLRFSDSVQCEMTAAIAVLALCDELKLRLLLMGVCQVLVPLMNSENAEVQTNSAAAIGNLSSKVSDYSSFVEVWDVPEPGLHQSLVKFLRSGDNTFKHIAVWTVFQFFEGGDSELIGRLKSSADIIPAVQEILKEKEAQTSTSSTDAETDAELTSLCQKVIELAGERRAE